MKNKAKSINSTKSIVSKVGLMLLILMLAVTALVACSPKEDVNLMAGPSVRNAQDTDLYTNQKLFNTISANIEDDQVLVLYYTVTYKNTSSSSSTQTYSGNAISITENTTNNNFDISIDGHQNLGANNLGVGSGETTRDYTVNLKVWYEARANLSDDAVKISTDDTSTDKISKYTTAKIVITFHNEDTIPDGPTLGMGNHWGNNTNDVTDESNEQNEIPKV